MLKANADTTTRTARRHRPAATIAAQIEELLRIRQEAEETAAFLIDILDEGAGDGDEEPSLGWIDGQPDHPDRLGIGSDFEDEDGGDDERWLGWRDDLPYQYGHSWYRDRDDLEEEHDGREDGGDEEPWLGSYNVLVGRSVCDGSAIWPGQSVVTDAHMDQSGWLSIDDRDLEDQFDGREPDVDDEDVHDAEADPAELGIADHDAIRDPEIGFALLGWAEYTPVGWDGSGRRIARRLLSQIESAA